jgi:hypothetical protein
MTAAPAYKPDKIRSDPFPVVGKFFSGQASPTADLYFADAHASEIEGGTVERFSSTVFRLGRTLIVFRHDGGLSPLPTHDRLVFAIDDDWRAGIRDASIPLAYRFELVAREWRSVRRLEAQADVIVVSSEWLAMQYRSRYPGRPVHVVEPVWAGPAADLYDETSQSPSIAVLGAMTHRRDNTWLIPALSALAERHPDLRVLWADHHVFPRRLAGRMHLSIVPVMGWDAYRQWLRTVRAQIGLYPLRPGVFNKARSLNKLGEFDQIGAAVVGSAGWASAREAEAQGACLLVPHAIDAWIATVSDLLHHPARAREIAQANRNWLAGRGAVRQRKQWREILSINMAPGIAPHRVVPFK